MNQPDDNVKILSDQLDQGLRELWLERAAIREFDGGLSRAYSEVLALLDLIRMDPVAVFACWQ